MAETLGTLKVAVTAGLLIFPVAPASLRHPQVLRPQARSEESEHTHRESRAFVTRQTTYEVSVATPGALLIWPQGR